MKSNYITWISK